MSGPPAAVDRQGAHMGAVPLWKAGPVNTPPNAAFAPYRADSGGCRGEVPRAAGRRKRRVRDPSESGPRLWYPARPLSGLGVRRFGHKERIKELKRARLEGMETKIILRPSIPQVFRREPRCSFLCSLWLNHSLVVIRDEYRRQHCRLQIRFSR
jgi:hypothetical protein